MTSQQIWQQAVRSVFTGEAAEQIIGGDYSEFGDVEQGIVDREIERINREQIEAAEGGEK